MCRFFVVPAVEAGLKVPQLPVHPEEASVPPEPLEEALVPPVAASEFPVPLAVPPAFPD
jgi:hypothetical protein